MEPILSNRGLRASDYAMIALPAVLLLSIYLLAHVAAAARYDGLRTCPLGGYTEYVIPPRG